MLTFPESEITHGNVILANITTLRNRCETSRYGPSAYQSTMYRTTTASEINYGQS